MFFTIFSHLKVRMCPKKAEAHPGNSVHGLHPSGFEFGVDIMGQIFQTGPEIEMSVFSIYMYKPSNCCIRFWPISWPISMLKMLKQWKFKVDMSKMMLLVMWNLCWFGKLCSFCAEWKFYLQPLMEEEVAAGLLFAWFDPSHFGLVMPSKFRIIASCHFIFTLFLLLLYYFIMRKSS